MAAYNRYGTKAEINTGDKVFVCNYGQRSVATVDAVTPGGNFKIRGRVYNADGALRGGGSWSRESFEPYNEAAAEAIASDAKRNKIAPRVRDAVAGRAESLPLDVWEALAAVLDAYTASRIAADDTNAGLHIPAEQAGV